MHLFQLENITFKPLLVIAEDFDHAAQIFMYKREGRIDGRRPITKRVVAQTDLADLQP